MADGDAKDVAPVLSLVPRDRDGSAPVLRGRPETQEISTGERRVDLHLHASVLDATGPVELGELIVTLHAPDGSTIQQRFVRADSTFDEVDESDLVLIGDPGATLDVVLGEADQLVTIDLSDRTDLALPKLAADGETTLHEDKWSAPTERRVDAPISTPDEPLDPVGDLSPMGLADEPLEARPRLLSARAVPTRAATPNTEEVLADGVPQGEPTDREGVLSAEDLADQTVRGEPISTAGSVDIDPRSSDDETSHDQDRFDASPVDATHHDETSHDADRFDASPVDATHHDETRRDQSGLPAPDTRVDAAAARNQSTLKLIQAAAESALSDVAMAPDLTGAREPTSGGTAEIRLRERPMRDPMPTNATIDADDLVAATGLSEASTLDYRAESWPNGTELRTARARYVLIGTLGASTHSETHLAYEILPDAIPRPVAVKRLLACPGTNWHGRRYRFMERARVGMSLRHLHLSSVLDRGELQGVPFLIREVVDGLNVRALIAFSEKSLSIAAVCEMGRQVADALAYIHSRADEQGESRQLVHGEVSPSSIIVGRDGITKVTEPGASRVGELTMMGCAPSEQVKGQRLDNRSDIFSLGVVLVELLSGRPLGSDGKLDFDSVSRRVAKRCDARDDTPPELKTLLERMTAPTKSERPSSTQSIVTDLETILRYVGGAPDLSEELEAVFARAAPGATHREILSSKPAPVAPATIELRPSDVPEALAQAASELPLRTQPMKSMPPPPRIERTVQLDAGDLEDEWYLSGGQWMLWFAGIFTVAMVTFFLLWVIQ